MLYLAEKSAYLGFSFDETQFPVGVFGSPNDSLEKKEGKDGIGKISFVMRVVGYAGQAPGRPDRPAMDLAMALKC